MRAEKNPLDLNNLPDDYAARDGKNVFEEGSSSSGSRRKKSGGKDGKDECGKIYECRFCSLKFCKSQALGGHMNRHRQERETETLNRARQLVFNNDTQGHLGCPAASYHVPAGDPTLPFRSVYPPRLFTAASASTLMPPPLQPSQPPYLHPSPSSRLSSYPSHQYPINDYYVGHVLGSSSTPHQNLNYQHVAPPPQDSSYTCLGAPVGLGFGPPGSSSRGPDLGGSGGGGGTTINRFQDGF